MKLKRLQESRGKAMRDQSVFAFAALKLRRTRFAQTVSARLRHA
jgi:hypothetical protein